MRTRPEGEFSPRRHLAPPPAPFSRQNPRLDCKLQLAPCALLLSQTLGFIATASAPPRPTRSSRRETRKRKPLERPPAYPPHSFPGPGFGSAGPSPSFESAESPPPPYSPTPPPPLRTKKAAGNPGLAGVQVISCFLMGSNSD